MKDARLLFIFANLCTLMLVVRSSNPDSEVFQGSSEEGGKASRSAPLSDDKLNPITINDNPYRYYPQIIVTFGIPFGAASRISQRFPVVSGYGTRTSFETGGAMPNNNNNNKRGDETENGNNRDSLSISARSPANGERTSGTNHGQEITNILPPSIPSVNSGKTPLSGVPISPNIPISGRNQNNRGTYVPSNKSVYVPPIPVGTNNPSNAPNHGGNQNNQGTHVLQSRPVYVSRGRPFFVSEGRPVYVSYVSSTQVGTNNPSNIPNSDVRPNGNMPTRWVPMTGRTTSQPRRGNLNPNNQVTSVNGPDAQSSAKSTPAPRVKNSGRISPDANLFAGMINDFSFNLIRDMNLKTNFVISPLSIFNALTMCYLASDGSTEQELADALLLNKNTVHGEIVHQSMKDLISIVAPKSAEYQLFIANGMFVGKNYSINPEFEHAIKRFYDGQLQKVDYGDPQLSVQIINNWVGEVTRNTIPSFASNIHPSTRVLLLNAVYFKGIWKKEFPPHATYEGRFNTLSGDSKATPTMPLFNESFYFLKSKEHRHSFIKLPYEGDEISMIIALPFSNSRRPMPEMTDQILCHVRDAMRETTLDSVTIPKFRLEFTKSLKKALTALGMPSLFNARSADFSRMRREKDLYVSDVHHKAVVEVNEQGTIAAAKTSVDLVPLIYQNTTDFLVDHPFAFYIIHEASGLILFYGKVFDLGV